MHDFCFTIPYGSLLIFGGLIGFLRKGSTQSLIGGVASGAILCFIAAIQLKLFKQRKNSFAAIFAQLAIAGALTYILGDRYVSTQKIFPAGVVAGLSGIMALFYAFKLLTGGNHFKKVASS
ncbi:hypothetical protein CLOM_g22857 [Closterium sp. NIES-68]|nr:hypothetical protein CLOM_g22857 [Closterium sp. NIES-68]GJP70301.1 hypothetical protein CLOP_g1248 [Closterium sp. NIES-67]